MKTRNKSRMSSSGGPFKREKKKIVAFYWRWGFSFQREFHENFSGTTSKGLQRTNFPLQDIQSPQSCRKCIWPRVISFLSASWTCAFQSGGKKNSTRNEYCLLTEFLETKPCLIRQQFILLQALLIVKWMAEWLKAAGEPWAMKIWLTWHSEDRASSHILITEASEMHYFSNLFW